MLFQSHHSETVVSPSLAAYAFLDGSEPSRNEKLCIHVNQSFQASKRHRSETDVDGESSGHLQVKKRKLRRDLITSRLSKPYAMPTTYIGSHGRTKPIPWPRIRGPMRSNIRKAAILNWSRQQASGQVESIGKGQDLYENRIEEGNGRKARSTVQGTEEAGREMTPAPFRPLDLMDYDALDLEDNLYADDPWVDCEDGVMDDELDQCDNFDEPFE